MVPRKLVRLLKRSTPYCLLLLVPLMLISQLTTEWHHERDPKINDPGVGLWDKNVFEARRLLVQRQQADLMTAKLTKLSDLTFDDLVPFKVFIGDANMEESVRPAAVHLTSVNNTQLHKDLAKLSLQDNDNLQIYRELKRVKGFTYDVFLFSAVAGNSSDKGSPWDTIVMQGWEHKSHVNGTFGCCIKYKSGKMVSVPAVKKYHWNYLDRVEMPVKQYVCLNSAQSTNDLPEKVTLSGTTSRTACHKLYSWYVPVTFAYQRKDEIAVCAKLVYGKLSADDLLAWFEIHRQLGVNKVLLYTYKLNEEASKVLEYYRAIGMAETIPFNLPKQTKTRKKVEIGIKNMQAWNDEQVPVFDCLEKLRGYKYMALIDVDEYIIPKRAKTWMELFDTIFKGQPRAAGFTFLVQLHLTTWNVTNPASKFKVGQYLNSSKPMTDRVKHVTMPDRLQRGGASTHQFYPEWEKGYKRFRAPENEAVIHHFRSCRNDWLKKEPTKCDDMERFTDRSVLNILSKLEPDILELKSVILGG